MKIIGIGMKVLKIIDVKKDEETNTSWIN